MKKNIKQSEEGKAEIEKGKEIEETKRKKKNEKSKERMEKKTRFFFLFFFFTTKNKLLFPVSMSTFITIYF